MSYLAGKPVSGILTSYTTASDISPTGNTSDWASGSEDRTNNNTDFNIPWTSDVTHSDSNVTVNNDGDLVLPAGTYYLQASLSVDLTNHLKVKRDSYSNVVPSHVAQYAKHPFMEISWVSGGSGGTKVGIPWQVGGLDSEENYRHPLGNGGQWQSGGMLGHSKWNWKATFVGELTSSTVMSLRGVGFSNWHYSGSTNVRKVNYDWNNGTTVNSDGCYCTCIEVPN